MLPSPHTLLKQIFNTPVLKQRLRRFLGIGKTQLYALLAGERPCLIERFCDLIDETLVIDRTGKKALRLAEYPRRYLRLLMREQAAAEDEWNNHAAANELLDEAAEAIKKLNSLDMNSLDRVSLEEARSELLDVQQVVRKLIARVDARLHTPVSGRQTPLPPASAARFSSSARGGQR